MNAIRAGDYLGAFAIFDNLLDGDLTGYPSYFMNVTGLKSSFNFRQSVAPEEFAYFNDYVVRADVRKAIHVGNLTFNSGKEVEEALRSDVFKSAKSQLVDVMMADYKVLLYSGQLDIIVAPPLTEAMIMTMSNWGDLEEYKKAEKLIWKVAPEDVEVAGYIRTVKHFHQAIIRRAGHILPADQPRVAFNLIRTFVKEGKFA